MSMKSVRSARRMASGTSRTTAVNDSVKLPARRRPSDNGHPLLRRGAAELELDHVVDRVVQGALGQPIGGRAQQRRARAAVRDLLEAGLVGDLERDEADLRARPGARDDALC